MSSVTKFKTAEQKKMQAEQLQSFVDRNLTNNQIAEILKITSFTAARRLLLAGIRRRPFWSDDRIDVLRSLWGEGYSCSMIADAMGDGITRNAVIGKAHRLNLSSRASKQWRTVAKTKSRVSMSPKRKPETKPTHKAIIPAPKPLMLAMVELTSHTCRFPFGDPQQPGFGFCGHKVAKPSKSYCISHYRIVYRSIPPERKPGFSLHQTKSGAMA